MQGSQPVPNCAVYYVPEAYEGDKALVVGRQSAGAGFLEGLTRYGDVDALMCYSTARRDFDEFRRRVASMAGQVPDCVWIRPDNLADLARAGCMFQPGPVIADIAWLRRYHHE